MEIQKLHTLVVLSESIRYTEAAERLYTTQSNVSKQVLSLERELGVPLVDRARRHLSLTPAGEEVVRSARRILAEYDAMCRSLQAGCGHLTLACIPVMAHYGVTSLCSSFRRSFPGLRLTVTEREDSNLPDAVRRGTWEMAVCRTDQDCPGLEKIVLYRDRLAAILPSGHTLARNGCLSLAQLRQEHFLQLGPTSALYQMVLDACRSAGFTPRISYTSTRMENLLELVREGEGISLMMEHAAAYLPAAGISIRPLLETVTSELSLVRAAASYHTPVACRFWEYTSEWIQQQTSTGRGARP